MKILFLYFINLGLIFRWFGGQQTLTEQTWSLDRPCTSEEIAEVLGISNLQAALDNQEYLDVMIPLEDEMLDLTEGSNTFFGISYSENNL